MKTPHSQKNLDVIIGRISAAATGHQSFETLFNLYTQSEGAQSSQSYFKDTELEKMSRQLEVSQDNLINLSANLTAKTIEDVLFKMAMWRRHAAQIDPFDDAMTGDERLGYSVFRDLAVMCERDEVFTDRDKQYLVNL